MDAASHHPFLASLFGKQLDMNKPRRRASESEEILKDVLAGSAAVVKDPEAEAEMRTHGLGRMVDMRIPLWGILSSVGALVMLLINMWLSVQQLTVAMVDVQATLKAGNTAAQANDKELVRMQGRMEMMEQTQKDLQQQLMQLQFLQNRRQATP
jgi:hypothetical protein